MDLNLVSAFVQVVDSQSFTAAAKTLGLPKSSVSRRVSELEREIGVELLHRTTRKLTLTQAGRAYYEQAQRALTGLEAAAETAAGLDSEPRGVVRVVATFEVGVLAMAEPLAEFAELYPEIHVDLSLSTFSGNLTEASFDIAVQCARVENAELVARRLGKVELGLFAAASYLERRGRPRHLSDLVDHDCVVRHGQNGRAIWRLDGPLGEQSSVEVRGRIGANEALFVRQAVALGLGIGLLPVAVAPRCEKPREAARLERVLPDYSLAGGELYVAVPAGSRRPRRITLLRDFLVERLAERCTHLQE